MARQVGRVLTFLTPYSKAHSSGQLVRSNLIYSWGSTHQGRESSFKFLGLSASLVAFGLGVHVIKNNKQYWEEPTVLPSTRVIKFWGRSSKERSAIPGVVSQAPYFQSSSKDLERHSFKTQTCRKNRTRLASFHGKGSFLWTFCPFLLIPASCEGSGGSDIICTCMVCSQERTNNYTSEGSGGAVAGVCKKQQPIQNQTTNVCPITPPNPPPQSNQPPQYNQPSQSSKYRTTTGPTPVSNKKCGSYSECSKASDPGVDVDALSRDLGGVKQMDWSMETDLSHCILMRQASQITVDSVTRILTEAISAYDDYHADYRRILDLLMDALELSRQACGPDMEVLECKIILIRAKADEMKRKIQEVDMFLGSVEKLCNAAAEAAFMAHAEYASIAMSERVHSMISEVKRLRDGTREKERDMLELQSLIIVETGKGLK